MSDKDGTLLMEMILDYIGWLKALESQRGTPSHVRHTRILTRIAVYMIHKGLSWDEMFTFKTLEEFQTYSGCKGVSSPLRALSDYLLSRGKIDQPFQLSKPKPPLPAKMAKRTLYY